MKTLALKSGCSSDDGVQLYIGSLQAWCGGRIVEHSEKKGMVEVWCFVHGSVLRKRLAVDSPNVRIPEARKRYTVQFAKRASRIDDSKHRMILVSDQSPLCE